MKLGLVIVTAAAALAAAVPAAADAPTLGCVDAKGSVLFTLPNPGEKGFVDEIARCLEEGGRVQALLKK